MVLTFLFILTHTSDPQYSSVDEAVSTRNAVYNLQWPLNNGNYLVAEFVDPHEVKLKLEHPPPPPAPISLRNDTTPETAGFQQSKDNQTLLPGGTGTLRELLPTTQSLKLFPASKPRSDWEMLPPPPKEPETPAKTLDDLFKRTQASPMIYYLPLSEEEVAAKLAARRKRKTGW
jgi:apoptotic chromatin condensation inducer in the nucleus